MFQLEVAFIITECDSKTLILRDTKDRRIKISYYDSEAHLWRFDHIELFYGTEVIDSIRFLDQCIVLEGNGETHFLRQAIDYQIEKRDFKTVESLVFDPPVELEYRLRARPTSEMTVAVLTGVAIEFNADEVHLVSLQINHDWYLLEPIQVDCEWLFPEEFVSTEGRIDGVIVDFEERPFKVYLRYGSTLTRPLTLLKSKQNSTHDRRVYKLSDSVRLFKVRRNTSHV